MNQEQMKELEAIKESLDKIEDALIDVDMTWLTKHTNKVAEIQKKLSAMVDDDESGAIEAAQEYLENVDRDVQEILERVENLSGHVSDGISALKDVEGD